MQFSRCDFEPLRNLGRGGEIDNKRKSIDENLRFLCDELNLNNHLILNSNLGICGGGGGNEFGDM